MSEENKNTELQPENTVVGEAPALVFGDEPAIEIETVLQNAGNALAQAEATVVQAPKFSTAEQQVIEQFAEKIDITNATQVVQYGSGAQRHIAGFSESALDKVRNKDMGDIGGDLSELVLTLKGFDGNGKGISGWFKNTTRSLAKMKKNYDKVESSVDEVVQVLEGHQVTLLKDIAMFNQMYDLNAQYYKELSMYIEAGRISLVKADDHLKALQKKAAETGATEDAQKASDYANQITRFEKRLYDLELTKTISLQMGPQIRMLQNNDSLMVEKINSSIVNTIPLWKSQMVLALGLENARAAIKAQKEVTDMTNKLLKENSEMLKTGTIEAAKEGERGIVEIETLQQTNADLISTIDTVLEIQKEGKTKRAEAEKQLGQIENQLKQKLLEVAANAGK
ncbi:MAG: toxic anion resistance protein [Eubacteriaceae bacterium]|nr:toxic anion resistance protein [Eubacteriaceae bacterium]